MNETKLAMDKNLNVLHRLGRLHIDSFSKEDVLKGVAEAMDREGVVYVAADCISGVSYLQICPQEDVPSLEELEKKLAEHEKVHEEGVEHTH